MIFRTNSIVFDTPSSDGHESFHRRDGAADSSGGATSPSVEREESVADGSTDAGLATRDMTQVLDCASTRHNIADGQLTVSTKVDLGHVSPPGIEVLPI
jgi:hypothetical protein